MESLRPVPAVLERRVLAAQAGAVKPFRSELRLLGVTVCPGSPVTQSSNFQGVCPEIVVRRD